MELKRPQHSGEGDSRSLSEQSEEKTEWQGGGAGRELQGGSGLESSSTDKEAPNGTNGPCQGLTEERSSLSLLHH